MKILTNKQYERLIQKEQEFYKEKVDELNKIISNNEYQYLEKYSLLEDENIKLKEELAKKEKKYKKIYTTNRKICGLNGALIKRVSVIEEELKEAKEKLSQRYIVKEITAEKSKNMQIAKIKSNSVTSRIIKQVVDK